ncbi:MAG: ABC transporter substrate-binding protein [Acidobacteria bacterium]|nr:ABC transporter substrate-binding protein [Acidobacteriota bacterium]
MRRCFLLALLLPLLVLLGCQTGPPTLNLLVWEGYADRSFAAPFEERFNCKVTATYVGTMDEFFTKIKAGGGGTYDLISPSGNAWKRFIDSDLVEALNLENIPNFALLAPTFQNLQGNRKDGEVYGVTFAWGPCPITYNRDAVAEEPSSWEALFDRRYRRRIAVQDDPTTLYTIALYMGYEDPYNLNDTDLQKVKEKLLELKPQVRKFWSTAGELINLFVNGEVDMALSWPLITNQLRQKGFNVGEVTPREGATGWIDSWMIVKGTQHKDLAEKWINYMLEPETQKKLTDVTDYCPAVPGTAALLTPERARNLHIDDPSYFDQLSFWAHVERLDRYLEVWNEVKAH